MRDWARARTAISRILTERRRRTDKALDDLRAAVSTVADTLGRAVADDRRLGARVKAELEDLRAAIDAQTPEEVRLRARRAVEVISGAMDRSIAFTRTLPPKAKKKSGTATAKSALTTPAQKLATKKPAAKKPTTKKKATKKRTTKTAAKR